MFKVFNIFISTFFLFSFFILLPKQTYAAAECKSIGINYTTDPFPIPEQISSLKVNFTNVRNARYRLRFALITPGHHVYTSEASALHGLLTIAVDNQDRKLEKGEHDATLEIFNSTTNSWQDYCQNVKYTVGYSLFTCRINIIPLNPTDIEQIRVTVINSSAEEYVLLFNQAEISRFTVGNNGVGSTVIGPISTPINNARLQALPKDSLFYRDQPVCAITNFTVRASGGTSPRPVPSAPSPSGGGTGITCPGDPKCSIAKGTPCGTDKDPAIATAIGCVHTSPIGFTEDILKFAVAISGGIAFLMMIMGAFQMLTSSGNPETLKGGQDRLTSAIVGLLIVILAVILLRFIGVDILGILPK